MRCDSIQKRAVLVWTREIYFANWKGKLLSRIIMKQQKFDYIWYNSVLLLNNCFLHFCTWEHSLYLLSWLGIHISQNCVSHSCCIYCFFTRPFPSIIFYNFLYYQRLYWLAVQSLAQKENDLKTGHTLILQYLLLRIFYSFDCKLFSLHNLYGTCTKRTSTFMLSPRWC